MLKNTNVLIFCSDIFTSYSLMMPRAADFSLFSWETLST
jgi:hypothetical protein